MSAQTFRPSYTDAPASPVRPGGPPEQPDIDIGRLETDLRGAVRGEIRFDLGSRGLYSMDGSNYREVPLGVVIPQSVSDLAEAVRVCHAHEAPILNRGCGTSLAGQTTNVAVVLDNSKYCNRILEIDPARRRAQVEPGVVLDDLRAAAKQHGLTFGPDPSTHNHCTLGGMLGNNSGGVHSIMAGLTIDNVESLDVLTYEGLRLTVGATPDAELEQIIAEGGRRGEIYRALRRLRDKYADEIRRRYPAIPRRVSGYNLNWLLPENGFHLARALVGSEGTCVTILEATLNLVPWPTYRVVLAIGFEDICSAADYVPDLLHHGPIGVEAIDDVLVANMHKKHLHESDIDVLPKGNSWMLVEFGGDSADEAKAKAERLHHDLENHPHVQHMRLLTDEAEQERMWRVREAGLGATAFVPGENRDTWEGWEDSAVAPAELGRYIRDLRALYQEYDYQGAMYGHFGDGLIHTRINFGLHTENAVHKFRRFMQEAAELVTRHGGSMSGEHGDGQARAELLPVMFGEELVEAFRHFRAAWDPAQRMNPHKLIHPRPLDANLRFGPHYHPPKLTSHFAYPDDHFQFNRALLRCVGVGECRRHAGMRGTMCPSYRATREEKHSTRGRARLLQEMLQADVIRDGWKSDEVREALDLCLSCKGCKGDCPVNVDMATYKAEFLAHYYEGRPRPRAAYSMGLIHRWARMISAAPVLLPGLVNFATQTPGIGRLARAVAGIAPQRPVPKFASRTFRQTWRGSRGANGRGEGNGVHNSKGRVILWTDSFNNHFAPEALHATVAVLEDAGYAVEIPERNLCCGRPYYDYGMLEPAKRTLDEVLGALYPRLKEGAWVVGLEPSCLATFHEELINFFPHDERAKKLKERSLLFSQFLTKVADYHPPRIEGRAIVHTHCYHKAIFREHAENDLLKRTGLDFEVLDDGCCGMAGSFGYETKKYEVSLNIAEQRLLPRVRGAAAGDLIIADGYSCREQVEQLTNRHAVTLPEVLRDAIRRRNPSRAERGQA